MYKIASSAVVDEERKAHTIDSVFCARFCLMTGKTDSLWIGLPMFVCFTVVPHIIGILNLAVVQSTIQTGFGVLPVYLLLPIFARFLPLLEHLWTCVSGTLSGSPI
ncbi:hypothetical protein HAX54_005246 [Datura stramonium]|uniref:Uncharacterized protein n=1 Tax=Datura stramonium TaxID=4076 RepID=A0ABS8T8E3_DATST|nr:hypothetical protein [Datura stramonium]